MPVIPAAPPETTRHPHGQNGFLVGLLGTGIGPSLSPALVPAVHRGRTGCRRMLRHFAELVAGADGR